MCDSTAEVVLLIERINSAAEDVPLPRYMTPGAAAMDLAAAVSEAVVLAPGKTALIPTGLRLAVPPGYEAQLRPRSGLALKHNLTVLNTPGTIDSDYRGEVKIILSNFGTEPFVITRGMRVCQMVIAPVTQVRVKAVVELPVTSRGDGGFGHTGV
ncbi:dUTP diphosphatase [bacterium]|nr:dUTP diphosphatase [bacterium]